MCIDVIVFLRMMITVSCPPLLDFSTMAICFPLGSEHGISEPGGFPSFDDADSQGLFFAPLENLPELGQSTWRTPSNSDSEQRSGLISGLKPAAAEAERKHQNNTSYLVGILAGPY